MRNPPQISFRGIDRSAALELLIQEKAARLQALDHRIQSISVMMEAPHRHRHQGRTFHARVVIQLPGEEIAVTRDTADGVAEDPFFVASHAFEAAGRQLREHHERARDRHREPRRL